MPQGEKTASDDEIVAWMREHPDPAFTSSEVAEAFGMTAEGARVRLNALCDGGHICRKKPTARTVIWWVEHGYSDVASA